MFMNKSGFNYKTLQHIFIAQGGKKQITFFTVLVI